MLTKEGRGIGRGPRGAKGRKGCKVPRYGTKLRRSQSRLTNFTTRFKRVHVA